MYEWIKALHVISVIAWMAGLFYLPRLYVYHCAAEKGSVQSETFKTMERRLLRIIMNPAMIASYVFGLWLLHLNPALVQQGHMQAKIALVLLLTVLHGMLSSWRRDFESDVNTRPARFYRIINEAPTVLMIGIVILVIVKPF
ncbi:MAG: protoporphyrinogen oxidase HemJ [Alphaproteobacteria bacterium]|nr:MAG: protoporphyrinogen oxidase HemJ [Alphaproteobacteria bacterium]